MKLLTAILVIAFISPLTVSACGPSPQKVIKEVVIKADPANVWAVIQDFGGIHKWHPAVISTWVEHKKDSDGIEFNYRALKLKDGSTVIERRRDTQSDEMKLGYIMVQGDIPVSNYSSWMTVKPGPGMGESTVTWVGRFSNKANAMEAPPGQDNKAAVAAINAIYEVGLDGMKKFLEWQK